MKKVFLLFFVLNLVICLFYIDTWQNGNTTSRILPIISYFESGTFQIDKYQELTIDKSFINNHYYSDKAPLPTFIVLPVFGLLKSIGLIRSVNGSLMGTHVYALGTVLCSIIPFVLILFLTFKKIYNNKAFSPVLLSMLPFYGSFIFIFSGTFFNHVLSALFLLLAYIYVKEKKYVIAGVFAGCAFLCEYIIAAVIFVWAIQILWNERNIKSVVKFSVGVLPAVIVILIYNYIFTGSAFTMLYKFHYQQDLHTNYGFSHPSTESLWGLVFSDYRGLLFYTPFLILVLIYVIKKATKLNGKEIGTLLISNYLFIPSVVTLLLTASYFGWWGGWTYGPRLLLFIVVILVYVGIIFLSIQCFSKPLFWLFILFGLITTFIDKATLLYSLPSETKHPFTEMIIPTFFSGNMNPNNFLSVVLGVNPAVSFIVWCLLFVGAVLILHFSFKKVVFNPTFVSPLTE